MARTSVRYYTFTETTGKRLRVPDAYAQSDDAAKTYAHIIKADNVVREDGPMSKPQVSMLWHHADPVGDATLNHRYKVIFDTLAEHFPYAPTSKVQAAAIDVIGVTQ